MKAFFYILSSKRQRKTAGYLMYDGDDVILEGLTIWNL